MINGVDKKGKGRQVSQGALGLDKASSNQGGRRRRGPTKETKFLLRYSISGFPLPSITLDLPLQQGSV